MLSGGAILASLWRQSKTCGEQAEYRQKNGLPGEFDTPDAGDDRPFRRSIERQLGVHSNRIAPEEGGPFLVRRGMVLDGMPCTDCPCPLWIAPDCAARRHGINRILSGAGGDNVLDGDPTLLGELALSGRPIKAARKAIRLRVGFTSPWWRLRSYLLG